jgi:hypothetical protein
MTTVRVTPRANPPTNAPTATARSPARRLARTAQTHGGSLAPRQPTAEPPTPGALPPTGRLGRPTAAAGRATPDGEHPGPEPQAAVVDGCQEQPSARREERPGSWDAPSLAHALQRARTADGAAERAGRQPVGKPARLAARSGRIKGRAPDGDREPAPPPPRRVDAGRPLRSRSLAVAALPLLAVGAVARRLRGRPVAVPQDKKERQREIQERRSAAPPLVAPLLWPR